MNNSSSHPLGQPNRPPSQPSQSHAPRPTPPPHLQQRAILGLALLSCIWGYNWVVMKVAVRDANPFSFAALRSLGGALALFGVLLVLRRSLRPCLSLRQGLGLLLFGLLQSGGSIGLLTWALVQGGAGKTAILTYTMSFWTLLLAWIVLGERLNRWQAVGVGLAIAGLGLLLPFSWSSGWLSKVLAVGAGFLWATASMVLKRLNRSQPVDLLPFTAWQMLIGSLPLLGVSVWVSDTPIHWTPSFVAALAYNAIPGSAIAWLLWINALKNLPAGVAGLAGLATPVVGLVAAAIQLQEWPSSTELSGIVLILVALGLTLVPIQR